MILKQDLGIKSVADNIGYKMTNIYSVNFGSVVTCVVIIFYTTCFGLFVHYQAHKIKKWEEE